MPAAISPIIFLTSILSKVIALVFMKHQNFMLETPSLAIGCYITINNHFPIQTYKQAFVFLSDI